MPKTKKRRTTRRRMGAALSPSSPLVQLGSVLLGYFLLADPINDAIDKMAKGSDPIISDMKDKMIGAGEAGLGGYLVLAKSRRYLIKTVIGGILAGAGVKRLLKNLKVISGFQNVPVVGRVRPRLGGFRQMPVIGQGFTPTGANAMTGYPIGNRASTYAQIMGSSNGSGLMR